MLNQIIATYLESHKRLVIPQLGALIVKEPGVSIVFSELLKRDDGVLRELLMAAGRSELEAAGEIDRLAFEVRHAVERGVGCPLPGVGVFKPGQNATITFTYDPSPAPDPDAPMPDPESTEEPAAPGHLDPEKVAENVKTAFEGHMSPSAKRNPEPYVKGLRYGKPPKTTDAYTFVGGRTTRRSGLDRFVVVAIVATLLAIGAIAFGFYQSSRSEKADTVEQTFQADSTDLTLQPDTNE